MRVRFDMAWSFSGDEFENSQQNLWTMPNKLNHLLIKFSHQKYQMHFYDK